MTAPSGNISSMLIGIRNMYLRSTAIGNWITAVGGAGYSTNGRVILGRKPQTNPGVPNGPMIYIRRGSLRSINAGAETTFTHELEIIADIVWFEDRTGSNDGVTQMNYVDDLIDEIEAVGNALAAGYGGQFLGTSCADLDEWEDENHDIHHCELVHTIWY